HRPTPPDAAIRRRPCPAATDLLGKATSQSRCQRRHGRGFGLMDRDQRIHPGRLEDLGDVVVGTQDDEVPALAVDDLRPDQENANAVRGEEGYGGQIDDDLPFFRDELVEWQLDDDSPGGIEEPAQDALTYAAGEIVNRHVHAAPPVPALS